MINLPSDHQDVVIDIEVFHCELQAGHSTEATLEQADW